MTHAFYCVFSRHTLPCYPLRVSPISDLGQAKHPRPTHMEPGIRALALFPRLVAIIISTPTTQRQCLRRRDHLPEMSSSKSSLHS